ncbi:lytic polysaccharide monooxygenase [Trematosphaeria pertusa]|uniref:Lytic polysaccharide monooxygenase n=1 Tax=Trematosphaeria pertusa TaxID=390896 RepID=A0A6A6I666_9PLEO|nr:lytic polysaccharide monooxygenase [Trematosphaeria pertusa]KAF2246035.1 lytic polysaccharide monooxygenase [Trematosphaeria pertusa]
MMFSQTSALLALAASASAHIILEYPVPYGKATLNSSPLAPGDYPCKQRSGVYDVTEMNQWNAGETKTISFIGSAVHGGGSCQFSVTTDKEPTEQSQWKVIQSVIGGCPSNVTGNLPENPDGHGAATFPVTMPEDMPSGQYTFAWTWLNKIGNREFYMNCAPVQVGSSGDASAADVSQALGSLPDMFVANLPATSCSTTEGEDFEYPNPGNAVTTGASAAPGAATSGAGCASMVAMGAGAGQLGSPAEATGAPASSAEASAPAATTPAATPAPSNPGGVFAPGASSAAPVASEPAATQPAAQPTQPAGTGVASPPASTGTPSVPSSGDCTPCETDGAVVCIGTNQFGLCNRGCAVAQDLAMGMSCSNGAITRRSIRFPRAHLHRRHGSEMI